MKKLIYLLLITLSLKASAQTVIDLRDTIPCFYFYADTTAHYDIVIYEVRCTGNKDTLVLEGESKQGKFITYYDSLTAMYDRGLYWQKGYRTKGKYLAWNKAELKWFVVFEPPFNAFEKIYLDIREKL